MRAREANCQLIGVMESFNAFRGSLPNYSCLVIVSP
jgi:hypothetical protein